MAIIDPTSLMSAIVGVSPTLLIAFVLEQRLFKGESILGRRVALVGDFLTVLASGCAGIFAVLAMVGEPGQTSVLAWTATICILYAFASLIGTFVASILPRNQRIREQWERV